MEENTRNIGEVLDEIGQLYSELAHTVSKSSLEIGTAFQRVGCEIEEETITINETASYNAEISKETKRSAEEIGNLIKSIYSSEIIKIDETKMSKIHKFNEDFLKKQETLDELVYTLKCGENDFYYHKSLGYELRESIVNQIKERKIQITSDYVLEINKLVQ